MIKQVVLAAGLLTAAAGTAHAVDLAVWTFETSVPTTAGPHAAEGGVNGGNALGFHSNGAVVYSNPSGNGSSESFSSNTWTLGDYYQFSTSTIGYEAITLMWDDTSSNTGPRDFNLFWSTNGSTFTQIGGTLSVLANGTPNPAWNSSTSDPAYTFGPTAGPGALDNQSTVFFRLVMASNVSANGGTVASAGTNRVDNVIIAGRQIPTPGAMALFGMAGLVGIRRRRG